MFRAMCGAKLMDRRRTEDLMELKGLKETVIQMAKANGVRWYRHLLRRDDGHVLRKALEFEVKESSEMESGSGRDCWQSGLNPATLVYGNKTGSKLD